MIHIPNTTDKYHNFKVAVYATMYDVQQMAIWHGLSSALT